VLLLVVDNPDLAAAAAASAVRETKPSII